MASEQQQVQRDDPGVEVGEHRDAADDRLGRDAEREHDREPAEVAPAGLRSAATNVRDRDRDQDERQHPVAELDRLVDAAARRAG